MRSVFPTSKNLTGATLAEIPSNVIRSDTNTTTLFNTPETPPPTQR